MAAAGGGTAATTTNTTSRFAAACGALSRYVKAAQMAHAPQPLPLMPGADDATTAESHEDAEPEPAPAPSQLTIVYGGHVLVLDDVTADRAAGLLAAAAREARMAGPIAAADLPVARKASLQRFTEKRRGRVTARAEPYLHPLGGADRADELTLAL